MAGKVILAIAYGMDVAPRGDPNVEVAEKAVGAIIAGSLRGRIFDLFPFRTSDQVFGTFQNIFRHVADSRTHALVVPWRWFQKGSAIRMGTASRHGSPRAVRDCEKTNGTQSFILKF